MRFIFQSVLICMSSLLFSSCKLQPEETTTKNVKAADLRITDEIQNWTENSYEYCSDIAALAQTVFNGEAYDYENQGLGESIYQTFSGGTGRDITVCVMSFPSASNASSAFDDKIAYLTGSGSTTINLTAYQSSVAVMLRNGADFQGYAHFDKFLIKLSIYGLQQQEAFSTAESFFGSYETMIGK